MDEEGMTIETAVVADLPEQRRNSLVLGPDSNRSGFHIRKLKLYGFFVFFHLDEQFKWMSQMSALYIIAPSLLPDCCTKIIALPVSAFR